MRMRLSVLLGLLCFVLWCQTALTQEEACKALTCDMLNRECGLIPDGCGGVLACGACTDPLECSDEGQCVKQGQSARSLEADEETDSWSAVREAQSEGRPERSLYVNFNQDAGEEQNDDWAQLRTDEEQPNGQHARSVEVAEEETDDWANLRASEQQADGQHARSVEQQEEVAEEDDWAQLRAQEQQSGQHARSIEAAEEESDDWAQLRASEGAQHARSVEVANEEEEKDDWEQLRSVERQARGVVEEVDAFASRQGQGIPARSSARRNMRQAPCSPRAQACNLHKTNNGYEPEDLSAKAARAPSSERRRARVPPRPDLASEQARSVEEEEEVVEEKRAVPPPPRRVRWQDAPVADQEEQGDDWAHLRAQHEESRAVHEEQNVEFAEAQQEQQQVYQTPVQAQESSEGASYLSYALTYGLPTVGILAVVAAGVLFVQRKRKASKSLLEVAHHPEPSLKNRRSSKHSISIMPSPVLSNGKPLDLYNLKNNNNNNNKSTPKLSNSTARFRINSPAAARMSPKVSAASLRSSQTFSL